MSTKTLTRSFAGGVITPEMFGRLDQVKYQTGLAEAINFTILPHGPAQNRAGLAYTLEVKDSNVAACLIPFIFSTTQSMVLEFGEQYVRFHTQNGTLLGAPQNISTISQGVPGVLTYVGADPVNGKWMFLSGIVDMPLLNGRFVKVANVNAGANTFELTDLAGVNIDTTGFPAWSIGGGTIAPVYEIVSPYAAADVFALHFTQSNDVLTITHTTYPEYELRRLGATNWVFTAITFAPSIAAPSSTSSAATVAVGPTEDYYYVTTALAIGTLEESYASPVSAATPNTLTTAGNFNTVTPAAVAGAVRYNVYRLLGGLYGLIGQTDGSALLDKNITPDTTRTPPIADNILSSAGNYAGAVGYFQGRRLFAGTLGDPQRVFATRSGTESNMSYSIPTRDSDRISFKIAARQANTVRHVVPLEDVILLTSGGVWVVFSTGGPLTGSSVDPRPKGNVGASGVQPVLTSQSVLYVTDRGNRIREFAFRGDINGGYNGVDMSIMAPHYFDKFTTKQMAFTLSPHPTAWAVRSDGVLLGLTYVPEHQVAAWHSHSTLGTFESICAVPEGNEDVLYAVVKRTINARTVRYVERLQSRLFATLADAFFLDSGISYSGAPATVFTNLWHLEGKTVNVLADGAVYRDSVVTNGRLVPDLPEAASKVHIGLPITAQMMTLPLALEVQAAGQGTQKNINKTHLRVSESSSIFAGPSYARVKQVKQRTTEPYGSPPSLVTDEKSVVVSPDWATDGPICVQQTDPLPITLVSMVLEVASGG